MRLDDITVIIPTRDEAHNIRTFLDSLPRGVSLIVVDASEDSTPDIIMQQRPERSLVLRHVGPISEARQLGAECCNTPWLLFSDADVAFAPGYFRRLCSHRDWDVVYGSKQSRREFARYYRWHGYGQQLSHWLGIPAASGSNLAIRRQVVSAAGGFDPKLVCNEDSELVWRVKRTGFRVHFDRALIVYGHDHRRLRLGLGRKSLHSIARCALLYCHAMPSRWRGSDWGYWTSPKKRQVGEFD